MGKRKKKKPKKIDLIKVLGETIALLLLITKLITKITELIQKFI